MHRENPTTDNGPKRRGVRKKASEAIVQYSTICARTAYGLKG